VLHSPYRQLGILGGGHQDPPKDFDLAHVGHAEGPVSTSRTTREES
jgi:hypothetical protein